MATPLLVLPDWLQATVVEAKMLLQRAEIDMILSVAPQKSQALSVQVETAWQQARQLLQQVLPLPLRAIQRARPGRPPNGADTCHATSSKPAVQAFPAQLRAPEHCCKPAPQLFQCCFWRVLRWQLLLPSALPAWQQCPEVLALACPPRSQPAP